MNIMQKLLLKLFGPSFIGRLASTVVSSIVTLLASYGFIIPPEVLADFSSSTKAILTIILASFLSGGIDLVLSHKDKPEPPEFIKK